LAKVVLITGGNKGTRFKVARQLKRANFIVLLGARDVARGEEAAAKLHVKGSDVAL
jgi:NAD(P)-dependent dehydrogenase (short-subunit alcohol dehydrogenase family)